MTKTDPDSTEPMTNREATAVDAMISLIKQGRVAGKQVAIEAVEQADFLIEELNRRKSDDN